MQSRPLLAQLMKPCWMNGRYKRGNQGSLSMIRRFMVMIAIAVALFPMCGDGTDI
jgi:hypothetical protein